MNPFIQEPFLPVYDFAALEAEPDAVPVSLPPTPKMAERPIIIGPFPFPTAKNFSAAIAIALAQKLKDDGIGWLGNCAFGDA